MTHFIFRKHDFYIQNSFIGNNNFILTNYYFTSCGVSHSNIGQTKLFRSRDSCMNEKFKKRTVTYGSVVKTVVVDCVVVMNEQTWTNVITT